ncbi:MAG: type IV pilin accessory protein [Acinetobacter towneri]|nr:type IV pilin accessory protein [Acinetobacter towneri]
MEVAKKNLKEKLKAFLVHFAISLFILIPVSTFIYLVWYPSPIFQALQANKILTLVVLIDLILGPTLTFIIYKKNKKTLKFDLTVIALVQIIALGFGLSSLALAKPVWIVFNGNKFELIQKNEIFYPQTINDNQYLSSNFFSKPKFVAVEFLKDNKLREKQMMEEVFLGISVAQRPENYIDIENQ